MLTVNAGRGVDIDAYALVWNQDCAQRQPVSRPAGAKGPGLCQGQELTFDLVQRLNTHVPGE